MKYTIYDNDNKMIFESNDMYDVDLFVVMNPSGNLISFHRENDIFIMYYECYTIFYKPL